MKKTFTININAIIFNIDDDAYEKLKKYLGEINEHFSSLDGGREIVTDIEARIAELFHEKISEAKQVITLADVDNVISIMGNPEDFFDDEEMKEKEKKKTKIKKRIYRNPENMILGGVCSGISEYFGIDPIILRLIFFISVFFYGTSIFIYLILWVIIPRAETRAQKLEMKGERVNIPNIEKSIKKEYDDVKDNLNNLSNTKGYKKARNIFSQFFGFLGEFLKICLKAILIIIGIAFTISGVISIAGITSALFWGHILWPFTFNSLIFPTFLSAAGTISTTLFLIGILLTISIPLILLIYAGLLMIFKFKSNNKFIGFGLLALWLIGLVILLATGLNQVHNYSKTSNYVKYEKFNKLKTNTIYLQTSPDTLNNYTERKIVFDKYKVLVIDDKNYLFGRPKLNIVQSTDNNEKCELKIKRISNGSSEKNCVNNAKKITYNFSENDSTIFFDNYFSIKARQEWKNQKIFLSLKIPVGKVIYLNQNMEDVIFDIENTTNTFDDNMLGHYWVMKPEGLTLLK
ncbi:MAG: PspC domain-containing protein [Bacteroidetes bacterium]|nr:PspC domain-containing protein [Bacteroidota bacterium]